MDLDLIDLRMIRAVADTGSITAAASTLGYSQPAVTQRLRRAERLLGQPLLLRSGRGVSLTEAGRRLSQHAVHVQAALDAAVQDLDELAGGVTGTLRLAGFPSASSTLVPMLLSAMQTSRPHVVVTYVEAEPPEAARLIRDGLIDLAFTFSYPGDQRAASDEIGDDVTEVPLYRDTVLVVAPDGTFEDEGFDFASLRSARFIGGCPRCRGHLLATCRAAGFEPDIVLETDNPIAVIGLVAAGLGVALLPSISLVTAQVPTSVSVRPLPAVSDRIVQVAHFPGAERVPVVAAALDAIRNFGPAPLGLRAITP